MIKRKFNRFYRNISVCILRNKFNFEKISTISLLFVGFFIFTHASIEKVELQHVLTWSLWLFFISCYHIYVVFFLGPSILRRTILNFASGMVWFYNSLLLFFFDFKMPGLIFLCLFILQISFSIVSFFIFSFLVLSSKIKIKTKGSKIQNGKRFNRSY